MKGIHGNTLKDIHALEQPPHSGQLSYQVSLSSLTVRIGSFTGHISSQLCSILQQPFL